MTRTTLRTFALAAAAMLLLACEDGSPSEADVAIRFETLAKATVYGHFGPHSLREVVRDEARYAALWREVWGPTPPPRPAIDFGRQMAVFASASSSCGGDVVIDELQRDGGGVLVKMGDSGPSPLCLCVQAEYTFHAVRATRVDGRASFEVRDIPSRCGG